MKNLRLLFSFILACGFFLALFSQYGVWKFGSLANSLLYLHGQRLIPRNDQIYLGVLPPHSSEKLEFVLQNFRARDLKVVGIRSTCSCVVTSNRTPTIPSFGNATISAELDTKSEPKVIDEEIIVLTDDDLRPVVRLKVGGVVKFPEVLINAAGPANSTATFQGASK